MDTTSYDENELFNGFAYYAVYNLFSVAFGVEEFIIDVDLMI